MRRSPRALLRIVLRRLRGNRRLVAALMVGVVLAVALMASTAIYRDAVDELGFRFDLEQQDPPALDLRASSTSHLAAAEDVTRDQGIIDTRLDRVGELLLGRTRTITSATFFPAPVGELPPEEDGRPRARFQFLSDLSSHVEITAGRFPTSTPLLPADAGRHVEVALGAETAARLGVALGDAFDLHPFWREGIAPVRVTVVGFVRARDLEERYWRLRRDYLDVDTLNWDTYAFVVPEATITRVIAGYLRDMNASLETLAYFDLDALHAGNAAEVETRLRTARQSIIEGVDHTLVESDLPDVLGSFLQKQFFSRTPVLVLTLQIVAIVLFYLVMIATMLVDRQAGEIALLKSRGGGAGQIVGVYAVEGLVLAGVGLVLGPLLALGIVALLGLTPAFSEVSGGDLLAVRLTGETYAWAAGGALLGLLALLWPAYRATQVSIVHYKQSVSRPAGRNVIQRYYLDLVLVAAGALLFFQLRDSDSLVTEDLFGGLKQDPLLLAAPAIFILTVAVIVLRLFPLLLAVVSRVADRFAGVAVQLALWRLVRAPLQHGRLVLLLILATSLGMFAATFGSTLERSFDDRAAYEAGAPVRLTGLDPAAAWAGAPDAGASDNSAPSPGLAGASGVAAISPVLRSGGSYFVTEVSTHRAEILAVDPEALARVGWFRDDFGAANLTDLFTPLRSNGITLPEMPIPETATYLGVWARLSPTTTGLIMGVRLRDEGGRYADFALNGPDGARLRPSGEWQFLVVPLTTAERPRGAARNLRGPLHVVGLFARGRGDSQFAGEVYWDALQRTTAPVLAENVSTDGFVDGEIIEEFESLERWELLTGAVRQRVADELSVSTAVRRSGAGAVRYAWTRDLGIDAARGIQLRADDDPLRVVASQSFLDEAGIARGDDLLLFVSNGFIPIRVEGTFDLFPTWNPTGGQPLIVGNLERFTYMVNRNPGASGERAPNEAWILPTLDGRDALRALAASGDLGSVTYIDVEDLRARQENDPLISAGWEGILLLAFLAVLLLSALGFLVSSLLTAQTRAQEFAILRTMGFSLRQIIGVISFEQLFVIALAMGIGTIVGLRMGVLMLEFQGITERGEAVVPPFRLVTNWGTIGAAYGMLGIVFLATIGVIVMFYARLAVHRVLRQGEL